MATLDGETLELSSEQAAEIDEVSAKARDLEGSAPADAARWYRRLSGLLPNTPAGASAAENSRALWERVYTPPIFPWREQCIPMEKDESPKPTP